MSGAEMKAGQRGVLRSHRLIPLHQVQEDTPLRVSLLVRTRPARGTERFVLLRRLAEVDIYLGAITDAGGTLREWVEIWVQVVGSRAADGSRELGLCNHVLDVRWRALVDAFRGSAPTDSIETGWSALAPRPKLLRLEAGEGAGVETTGATGDWELCRDDAVLASMNLARYATTLERHVRRKGDSQGMRFVRVTGETSSAVDEKAREVALGATEGVAVFNAEAGMTHVTRFFPMGLEDYLDVLAGKPWAGVKDGAEVLPLHPQYQDLADGETLKRGHGHLFLAGQGRAGRFVEILHLKLALFGALIRGVRRVVQGLQAPFLNLSSESFRVRLEPLSPGLPLFWTASASIAKPGAAWRHRAPEAVGAVFRRRATEGTSLYLPPGGGAEIHDTGSVRLRRVQSAAGGCLDVEGTLSWARPFRVGPRDLLILRLPVAGEEIELYAHVQQEGLAAGEVQFTAKQQLIGEGPRAELLRQTAVAFPPSPFHFVPQLSTPCDLYSLGVLAARVLLARDAQGLPIAFDELMGLIHQVNSSERQDRALPARIAEVFGQKADWLRRLGPQRLSGEELEPAWAISSTTADLWFEVLAAVVRLFPGAPESPAKDLGDAPPQALERVFERAVMDFERLIEKTRSLIVIDWTYHREIRTAIDALRGK